MRRWIRTLPGGGWELVKTRGDRRPSDEGYDEAATPFREVTRDPVPFENWDAGRERWVKDAAAEVRNTRRVERERRLGALSVEAFEEQEARLAALEEQVARLAAPAVAAVNTAASAEKVKTNG